MRKSLVLWFVARLGAALYASGVLAASALAADTTVAQMAAIKCVYASLKSNSEVQSVAAYSIDDFRRAVEYTIRSKDGHVLIGDLLISGIDTNSDLGVGVVTFHGESKAEGFEELEFLTKAVPDMDSKCHLAPVIDNLMPRPKPRSEWQRIDLEN